MEISYGDYYATRSGGDDVPKFRRLPDHYNICNDPGVAYVHLFKHYRHACCSRLRSVVELQQQQQQKVEALLHHPHPDSTYEDTASGYPLL